MIRANFNLERDAWLIFKTMSAKLKAVEHGKQRQATASDVLRELIYDWITEHESLLNDVLEDMKKIGAPVKVEEWKTEEEK